MKLSEYHTTKEKLISQETLVKFYEDIISRIHFLKYHESYIADRKTKISLTFPSGEYQSASTINIDITTKEALLILERYRDSVSVQLVAVGIEV